MEPYYEYKLEPDILYVLMKVCLLVLTCPVFGWCLPPPQHQLQHNYAALTGQAQHITYNTHQQTYVNLTIQQ